MSTDLDSPADTRMMSVVHAALRRDLARARTALRGVSPPSEGQRRAIAEHLRWMMEFLHHHHRSEDEGLYPLVRSRDPQVADLIDAMRADHEEVASRITRVDAAAAEYALDDSEARRDDLVEALDDLDDVLLPHLAREEDEVMPVVAATLTDGEWRAVEHEHNVKPKSFVQLAREGHWLIDEVSPDDRDHVLGLVPLIPRIILLRGFARAHRRRSVACWGKDASAARRVQKSGRTEVWVDVDPERVWAVVRDVTRVGEWSHECMGARWVGDATSAVPGARFRGRNRAGIFRWGRLCEIVAAEPRELVWRTVPSVLYPDSSEWRIRVIHADDGTRIEQTFQVLRAPKVLDIAYGTLVPGHRDRTQALTEDLQRLGRLAAGAPTYT
jgi:hemerythrin-like domain-containing protein